MNILDFLNKMTSHLIWIYSVENYDLMLYCANLSFVPESALLSLRKRKDIKTESSLQYWDYKHYKKQYKILNNKLDLKNDPALLKALYCRKKSLWHCWF